MAKVTEKTTETKGAIVETTIVSDSKETSGLTKEGKVFLDLYLSRKDAGKTLSNVAAGLRALKSEETRVFWGKYAILTTGFGGTECYKAPAFDKKIFEERLKALGWKFSRFPTAQKVHAKKHGLPFGTIEKAFLDQEEASRAAAKKEKEIPKFPFADDTLKDILRHVSDEIPLGLVLESFSRAVKARFAEM